MSVESPGLATFDHLIVLMLENRSFDNLFGYLYESDQPARFIGRGEPVFRGVAGRSWARVGWICAPAWSREVFRPF